MPSADHVCFGSEASLRMHLKNSEKYIKDYIRQCNPAPRMPEKY